MGYQTEVAGGLILGHYCGAFSSAHWGKFLAVWIDRFGFPQGNLLETPPAHCHGQITQPAKKYYWEKTCEAGNYRDGYQMFQNSMTEGDQLLSVLSVTSTEMVENLTGHRFYRQRR